MRMDWRNRPRARAHRGLALVCLAVVWSALAASAWAHGAGQPAAGDILPKGVASGRVAALTYNNRLITQLRATLAGYPPEERVASIRQLLDQLVESGTVGPIDTRAYGELTAVVVGSQIAFVIAPQDVDQLAGETIETKTRAATVALQVALQEAVELRTPRRLLGAALWSVGATALLVLLLWGIRAASRVAERPLVAMASERLQRIAFGDAHLLRATRLLDLARRFVDVVAVLAAAVLVFVWATFVLRQFPYTRPWGESLRAYRFSALSQLALGFAQAVPGLFTVAAIFLITRFFVRLMTAVFDGVEHGRFSLPWVYPDTAQPTRRLINAMLWLFALIAAYPHLPGSGTDAFKGVSVFVGLIISLGSSGIVNHIMSSFMITYSRALHLGDYIRAGEVEGLVTSVGMLSTKVKTHRREEVTIPNAVLVSQTITNYSKFSSSDGVYVPTTVTIGYDTPWRQVEALLLIAAERTPGVRRDPKPMVFQTALQDFYVQYTLLLSLERPEMRGPVLNALHANVQDAFNEYGVQIMSPNYRADPAAPKIVPKEHWFDSPGRAEVPSTAPKP
jgi:small-conductance mechanosensitive channel